MVHHLRSFPSASCVYTRKFPESTFTLKFNLASHFAPSSDTSGSWRESLSGPSGQTIGSYIIVWPPRSGDFSARSADKLYIIFCNTEADRQAQMEYFDAHPGDGRNTRTWHIRLDNGLHATGSTGDGLPAADGFPKWMQIIDSNAQASGSAIARMMANEWYRTAPKAWRDVATISHSGDKVYLNFKGVWEKSFFLNPDLNDDFAFASTEGNFMVVNNTEPVNLSEKLKPKMRVTKHLAGGAKWEVGDMTGRNPFPADDYDDWQQEMRRKAKDFSILPEYRISEHMPFYVDSSKVDDPFFTCHPDGILEITGAADDFVDSSKSGFFKVYGHSDFLKHFDEVTADQDSVSKKPGMLTLRCKAMKKFLPYEGFYPVQRTMQLATLMSESYSHKKIMPENKERIAITGIRPMMAAFYAPGICYNSIKSGIAVDYPIFEPADDRPFNLFATVFKKETENYVTIGKSSEWASMLSGSGSPFTGSASGFTFSMWVNFLEDPDAASNAASGSLLVFNDSGVTKGIQFTKHGGRLMLSMYNDGSNFKKWWTQKGGKPGVGPLRTANQWHHVAVTKKLDGSAPKFYVDGIQWTTQGGTTAAGITGTGGTINELTLDMDHTGSVAVASEAVGPNAGNCTIGNHRAGHTATNHNLNAMECAITEVTIWNSQLDHNAIKGLSGARHSSGSNNQPVDTILSGGVLNGGVGPRTPWNCVSPSQAENLVGWFRMGNDSGYMWSGSGSVDMTNNMRLHNHAIPTTTQLYARDTKASNNVQIGYTSITKGRYRNFIDLWTGRDNKNNGGGITLFGDGLLTTAVADAHPSGAFKVATWVTGAAYNQTIDSGIPRIGSSSVRHRMADATDANIGANNYWVHWHKG